METIENILAVIGLVSLAFTVIRVAWVFFGSGIEWIDNVKITEIPYDENAEDIDVGGGVYPQYFKAENLSEYATATMIIPQSIIIRNLKIKRVDDSSICSEKLKYRTVETLKNVTPQYPLCLICERREAIAEYCVEWRIDYGGKATYYFYDNLRDGNNNRNGIEYTFGFFSKLRKLLDLK